MCVAIFLKCGFLSYLFGSLLLNHNIKGGKDFLSYLFGSLRVDAQKRVKIHVSKLPIRQFTIPFNMICVSNISKLPIRQFTTQNFLNATQGVSKLPIRQFTRTQALQGDKRLSKLPIRQFTVSCAYLPYFWCF